MLLVVVDLTWVLTLLPPRLILDASILLPCEVTPQHTVQPPLAFDHVHTHVLQQKRALLREELRQMLNALVEQLP